MTQQTKKKRNPRILNWLVDPDKGLFSPLTKVAVKAIQQSSQEEVRKVALEKVLVSSPIVKGGKIVPISASSPETLQEMKDAAEKAASDSDTSIGTILVSEMALDLIPLANLSFASYLRLPGWQATIRRTIDAMNAEWNFNVMPKLQRYWNSRYTPLIPEPYRLAEQFAKGLLPLEEYYEAMAENGLGKEWADKWGFTQYEFPALDVGLTLLRRGEITETRFRSWMGWNSWRKDAVDASLKLREVIPPIQDLRLMAIREAFPVEPGRPQYVEMEKWALKQGLSPYFTERYFYAGFRRMDVAEAMRYFLWYNNLPADFEKWLVIADIHPDDRARVKTVSYVVPSIRELGYGFDMGVYTLEEIEEIRRRGGLNPEDAKKAAGALVAYRVSAEMEAVRREWLHLYALEKKTKEAFSAKLKELNTSPEAIALWLERGDLERERKMKPATEVEYRIVTSSEALWVFEHGVKDEMWTRAKLSALDWTKERIDVAILRVKTRLKEAEKPPKPVVFRDLTVSQIRSLWQLGKITDEEVPLFLEAIGYSPEDAVRVAEVIMVRPPEVFEVKPYSDAWSRRLYAMRLLTPAQLYENYVSLTYDAEHASRLTLSTLVDELYPVLVAKYRKGWINDEVFIRELWEVGMEIDEAIELYERTMDEFQLERLERERDLTKSEILKGVKQQLLTPLDGVRLLTDLGYDEWEAVYILEVNKVVAAGDPEGYWEMRRVTEALKKAQGKPYVEIPDELLMLEKAVKDKRAEIEKLKAEDAPEARIGLRVTELAELEGRYRKVVVKAGLG